MTYKLKSIARASPDNVPLLRSDSLTIVIKDFPRNSINIGCALTDQLSRWNIVSLEEDATALISSSDSPVQLHIESDDALQSLGVGKL